MDTADVADRGRRMTEYIGSLRPGAFATMAGTEEFFTAETADERFEFGLDVLLGGLVAMTG